jgi:hypothetical protein
MKVAEIFKADTAIKQPLPFYLFRIKAGFPSPVNNAVEMCIRRKN